MENDKSEQPQTAHAAARRKFKEPAPAIDLLEASHQPVPHGPLDDGVPITPPSPSASTCAVTEVPPGMVAVRLRSQRFKHFVDGVEVEHKQGDVFVIDRATYAADIEPDRGMGIPAHHRTFISIADEQAAQRTADHVKVQAAEDVQTRIAATREGMRDYLRQLEEGRIRSRAQEAENVRAAAESLRKPIEGA